MITEVEPRPDFNTHEDVDFTQYRESVRQQMRQRALTDTFYLATVVLGYEKLTPHTHGPLCTFLDTCTTRRRLIQMPRSHFKTTIVTVVKRIQDVLLDPTLRILIVGDTITNAQKHLAKIKLQFERNRMLAWLFPERIWHDRNDAPAWSKQELYLPITTADGSQITAIHGEPTFDTVGARGAVVSRHYDIINADDLIGESEYYSNVDMDKTIDWFTGLEALFVPPVDQCLMDIPSTYWRHDDVYAFAEDYFGMGEEVVPTGPYSYVRGAIAVFRRGVRENGKLIFPEGMDEKYLQRLQTRNPERYAAQYANNPKAAGVSFFSPEWRKYYQPASEDGRILRIGLEDGTSQFVSVDQMEIYSMCDPHAGGRGNQRQLKFRTGRAAVLTTGVYFTAEYIRIFILDTWIRRAPTNEIVDEIYRQNEKWMPMQFSIEANGMQKMLKWWIEERAEREMLVGIPYKPFVPKGSKDDERRIRGLQPLFRAGMIYGQAGFSELWEEYTVWPRGFQDGLDALSQGLEMWPTGFDTRDDETREQERDEALASRSTLTGY